LETSVRISGQDFLMGNQTMSNGQGVFTTVFAIPVHVGGFDYWHIYSAYAVPTLVPPTALVDHDADFPVNTVMRFQIVRADASTAVGTMTPETTLWTELSAGSFSGSDPHTILAPLGGALVSGQPIFAGLKITFGPGGVPTYTPAQWNALGDIRAEYPQFAAPEGETDWGFNQIERHVAADERGTFFVMTDLSTIGGDPSPSLTLLPSYAVPLGSVEDPVLVADPVAEGATRISPTPDGFPISTRAPVMI
jgi:hypothetical protein